MTAPAPQRRGPRTGLAVIGASCLLVAATVFGFAAATQGNPGGEACPPNETCPNPPWIDSLHGVEGLLILALIPVGAVLLGVAFRKSKGKAS